MDDNVFDFNGYLVGQDEKRWQEASYIFGELSERERHLVRDAAVMGFVEGSWSAGGISREDFPEDALIIRNVLLQCEEMSDLYPTIGNLRNEDEQE